MFDFEPNLSGLSADRHLGGDVRRRRLSARLLQRLLSQEHQSPPQADRRTSRIAKAILVQLRRERGLTSGGDYRLAASRFNKLVLQSGLTHRLLKLALIVVIAVARCGIRRRADVSAAMPSRRCARRLVLRHGCCPHGAALPAQPPAEEIRRAISRRASISSCVSLRAGHPVPIAITMVAREMTDPIGTEFGIVSDEITYGADLETAMRNLFFRIGTGRPAAVRDRGRHSGLDRRQPRRNPGKSFLA